MNYKLEKTQSGKIIKLGLDVHARSYVVSRQLDGATPQPAQKFNREGLLKWAAKQVASGATVYSCYEAGPLGYGLHRQLERLGIKNVVIRPQKLDELGKGVKNDNMDAQMLVQRLDRYVNGNKKALAIVRVPSEQEEQERSEVRQCEQLKRHRSRLILQGNGILMYNGHTENKRWWGKINWKKICEEVPEHIIERLKPLKEIIAKITEQEKALTTAIEAKAPKNLPFGLGLYTFEQIRREVGNWNRFTNRRQVGSYILKSRKR